MNDPARPRTDLYAVAVRGDMFGTSGHEVFFAHMVDNQPFVVPETIDAIRALMGWVKGAAVSIARTDDALSISAFRPAGESPVECCSSGPSST